MVLREREQELEQLHTHIATLQVKEEKLQVRVERFRVYCEFLHTVLKTATKVSHMTHGHMTHGQTRWPAS